MSQIKEKNRIEDYVARISHATPLQLVIITYELVIENILNAIEAHGKDNVKYKLYINRAQNFLAQLIDSLDLSVDIGNELMVVYIQINKLLITSTQKSESEKNDVSLLQTAKKMLSNLLEGWEQIAVQDTSSEPVMKNTQPVYAGLTYGKSGLNEYVDPGANRGFKA